MNTFNYLRGQDYFKNLDIVHTTNKILVEKTPEKMAVEWYLRNKSYYTDVRLILQKISKKERTDYQRLSNKKLRKYIVELNKILMKSLSKTIRD